MVIVVRVLGLLLCAMAIQFMLTGLASSTVNLVRRDTATPYQQHGHGGDAGRTAGAASSDHDVCGLIKSEAILVRGHGQ